MQDEKRFPVDFTQKYIVHVRTVKTPLVGIFRTEGLIKDFQTAVAYTEKNMLNVDFSAWTPETFLKFICGLHRVAAGSSYLLFQERGEKVEAGKYRTNENVILRHPPANPQGVPFFQLAGEAGRIGAYLKVKFGAVAALHYWVGYYKTNAHLISENARFNLSMMIKVLDLNYNLADLALPLTPPEIQHLNMVYKTFSEHEKLPGLMHGFAKDFLVALNKKDKNMSEFFAEFYLRFIDIHPFRDLNGIVIKLILNAVLITEDFKTALLLDEASKLLSDYLFNSGSPDSKKFAAHLKTQCVRTQSSLAAMHGLNLAPTAAVETENPVIQRLKAIFPPAILSGGAAWTMLSDNAIQLTGKRMKKEDQAWFKNRLLKAGVPEGDIVFVEKNTEGGLRYLLRINNSAQLLNVKPPSPRKP